MQFLGILKKAEIRNILVFPERIICVADTVDKQIQCLKYEPLKPYLYCIHCGNSNDICYYGGKQND